MHRRGPCGAKNAMNIVVCVKYVPDATADRHFESDNTVDRVGVPGLLSELDEYAVEQALQIKEKAGDDTEVTAVCIGPEKALDAVRTWRFEPARKDGVPVAVQISVEVNFRLY